MSTNPTKIRVWTGLEITKIIVSIFTPAAIVYYTISIESEHDKTKMQEQDKKDSIYNYRREFNDSIYSFKREYNDRMSTAHKDSLERESRLVAINLTKWQILHQDTITRNSQNFELKNLRKQDQLKSFREAFTNLREIECFLGIESFECPTVTVEKYITIKNNLSIFMTSTWNPSILDSDEGIDAQGEYNKFRFYSDIFMASQRGTDSLYLINITDPPLDSKTLTQYMTRSCYLFATYLQKKLYELSQ